MKVGCKLIWINNTIYSSRTLRRWFCNKHINKLIKQFIGEDKLRYLELKFESASRPCLIKMTDILVSIPELYDDGIKNSDVAILFHKYLLEKCGISAKGSYLYGSIDSGYLEITIWADDNSTANKLLNGTRYQLLHPSDECFYAIIDCLCKALAVHDEKCYKKVTELQAMQKKRDSGEAPKDPPSLCISFRSFVGIHRQELFGGTAPKITDQLRRSFPEYKHIECISTGVLYDGVYICHEFLFFTPKDQDTAMLNGDIEKMTEIAYQTLSKYDKLKMISKYDYHPEATNLRMYTREELFIIARY